MTTPNSRTSVEGADEEGCSVALSPLTTPRPQRRLRARRARLLAARRGNPAATVSQHFEHAAHAALFYGSSVCRHGGDGIQVCSDGGAAPGRRRPHRGARTFHSRIHDPTTPPRPRTAQVQRRVPARAPRRRHDRPRARARGADELCRRRLRRSRGLIQGSSRDRCRNESSLRSPPLRPAAPATLGAGHGHPPYPRSPRVRLCHHARGAFRCRGARGSPRHPLRAYRSQRAQLGASISKAFSNVARPFFIFREDVGSADEGGPYSKAWRCVVGESTAANHKLVFRLMARACGELPFAECCQAISAMAADIGGREPVVPCVHAPAMPPQRVPSAAPPTPPARPHLRPACPVLLAAMQSGGGCGYFGGGEVGACAGGAGE